MLECGRKQGCKESDTTEQLNNNIQCQSTLEVRVWFHQLESCATLGTFVSFSEPHLEMGQERGGA